MPAPKPIDVARSYHEKAGIPFDPTPSRLTLDPRLSIRTGLAFARMKHDPANPKVKAAYDALKRETLAQFEHLEKSGVKMEPWRKDGQPYANSKEMRADAENGHLWYFPTDNGFGSGDAYADHPLYEEVPGRPGLRYNDAFRAVHDYFAHAVHGHPFGPKGELRAWHEHARKFTPEARAALTTETHGQNSWVNFGPHKPWKLPVTERPYADQKAGLLPEEVRPLKLARGSYNRYTDNPGVNADGAERRPATTSEYNQVLGKLLGAVKHPDATIPHYGADGRLRGLVSKSAVEGGRLPKGGFTVVPEAPKLVTPQRKAVEALVKLGDQHFPGTALHAALGRLADHPNLSENHVAEATRRVHEKLGKPTIREWKPGMEPPKKLERMKAPAGGTIVNNVFTPGGQFIPQAVMKIRDAVKRRRAAKKLSRMSAGEFVRTVFKFARKEFTTDIPVERRKTELPNYAPDKLAAVGFDPHLPGAPATLSKAQIRAIEDAHNLPKRARLTEGKKLTERDDGTVYLKKYEHYNDFMDALSKSSLSGHPLRKALDDPKHSSAERMVFLVNHLAGEARSFAEGLRRGDGAAEWYGKYLDGLDLALHHVFARGENDPIWGKVDHKNGRIDRQGKPLHETAPGLVLARAVIATTSGNLNPKSNLVLAYKMIKNGIKRGGPDNPFGEAEDKQHGRLAELLARIGHDGTVLPGGFAPDLEPNDRKGKYAQAALEFAQKHLDPITSSYGTSQQLPVKQLKAIVHKPTNRVLGWVQNDRVTANPEAVAALGRDEVAKHLARAKRGLKDYQTRDIPTVSPDGKLEPREWSQRPMARDGLLLLQRLLREHTAAKGGNTLEGMKSLAGWLTSEHPRSVLEKYDTKNATFPEENTLPGSFVFGPKFGSFMLNLLHHDPDPNVSNRYGRFLTADMWWSRTWGRYVGRLRNLVVGKGGEADRYEPVKAPDDWQRPVMQQAAQHAAKLAGLRSVAELQAVLWYWEQHLSRLFGLQSKSYSYTDGANEVLARHALEQDGPLHQVGYDPKRRQAWLRPVAGKPGPTG